MAHFTKRKIAEQIKDIKDDLARKETVLKSFKSITKDEINSIKAAYKDCKHGANLTFPVTVRVRVVVEDFEPSYKGTLDWWTDEDVDFDKALEALPEFKKQMDTIKKARQAYRKLVEKVAKKYKIDVNELICSITG